MLGLSFGTLHSKTTGRCDRIECEASFWSACWGREWQCLCRPFLWRIAVGQAAQQLGSRRPCCCKAHQRSCRCTWISMGSCLSASSRKRRCNYLPLFSVLNHSRYLHGVGLVPNLVYYRENGDLDTVNEAVSALKDFDQRFIVYWIT